jgi:hypothetical protein
MRTKSKPAFEMSFIRQAFPTWWISVPPEFETTFVHGDDYWHAWDARRSVSLTSIVLTDPRNGDRPVPAAEVLEAMTPMPGEPVPMPEGLAGWAVVVDAPPPARATRAVTGIVVVDGRVLLGTITADDIAWATTVWRSIQYGPERGATGRWALRDRATEPDATPAPGAVH